MRREFNETTIITIAHRLGTIIDYDKILVLKDGSKVEFDCPYNLMKRDSEFKKMIIESGESLDKIQKK